MPVKIKTPGVHHLTLRSANYDRSKKFYTEIMGFEIILEQPNLFIFFAGDTAIAIRGPEQDTPSGDQFNPFRVGMDHVALACESKQELQRVADALSAAQVTNTGIKIDPTLGKSYIAFKDPDRISWEFYMT